ncbi:hypothetical protein QAD02_012561 [Eretmocerus hayati]|uniref:Uncharacterized protein n=1 Tax=Eretmocerus hayati TaxID=131215 RepID=A0ACC2P2M5_9HYME|nr:hypothetical protein QAD02_012561 [Eretmocerus hayati]
MQPNQCFLCGKKDDLRSLTDSTYDNLRDVIRYRKFKEWQYGELVLPSRQDAYYHTNCYEKVSTITKEDSNEMKEFSQEDQNHGSGASVLMDVDDTPESNDSLNSIHIPTPNLAELTPIGINQVASAICELILGTGDRRNRENLLANTSEYMEKRKIHDRAFEHLCILVQKEILTNEKVMLLTRIFEQYKYIYRGLAQSPDEEFTYPARHIENKLLHHSGDQIESHLFRTHNRKVIYTSNPNLQR